MERIVNTPTCLSDEFLARIVTEFNEDMVTAIILHGSYARGEALPPYSDVDLVCITKENKALRKEKRFMYREGYLLSVSSRPLSVYRKRFRQPEMAIFAIPGVREALILLDKNGAFRQLQQEAWEWTWEPLQVLADEYISQLMVEQTEIVLKLLRAMAVHDLVALSEMILDLFVAVTDAVAIQGGVLVRSGNTYFHQVQEFVGKQSVWTQYHLRIAGITTDSLSLRERGRAALSLYEETAQHLKPSIRLDHWHVVEQTIHTIECVLPDKEIG